MIRTQGGVVEVEGGWLAWESSGEGPAVVFLHPGLWDRRVWDGQVGVFSESNHVVRYDLRGYGRSSRPEPGASYSHVDDLAALMDAVGFDSAALIGNSMGGRVAIDFALTHPARLGALVLAAPALSGFEGNRGGGGGLAGGVRRRRARDRGGRHRRGSRARPRSAAAAALGAARDRRSGRSADPADRPRQSARTHDG